MRRAQRTGSEGAAGRNDDQTPVIVQKEYQDRCAHLRCEEVEEGSQCSKGSGNTVRECTFTKYGVAWDRVVSAGVYGQTLDELKSL